MKLPSVSNRIQAEPGYMPQLDGLRALAVGAVVIHHYSENGWTTGADLGVKLFFVISGYLITGILIRSRNRAEHAGGTGLATLQNFYVRRFLRIFPLYYFVVFVLAGLAIEPAREYLAYLLTYTLNIKMASQGWYVDRFAHFWTLCVEEHFYLLWPWIILLARRTWLAGAGLGLIAVAIGYRLSLAIGWMLFDLDVPGLASYIFTLACFDTLGAGCFISILTHSDVPPGSVIRMATRVLLPLGIAGYAILSVLRVQLDTWVLGLVFRDFFVAMVFGWVVLSAANGFGGVIGRFLALQPIRFIGKISYGIYVYHPLVPDLLRWLLSFFGATLDEATLAGFTASTVATLGISALSWYVMEKPINQLKRRFAS